MELSSIKKQKIIKKIRLDQKVLDLQKNRYECSLKSIKFGKIQVFDKF